MKIIALAIFFIYIAAVFFIFIRYKIKSVQYIFVGSFILLLVLPIIFLNTKDFYSVKENRKLASFPNIKNGNISIFEQIDNYISDRFGFKNYFVVINTAINRNIFHLQYTNRVLYGKDGWLFYIDKNDGDNLSDFQKTNLLDEDSIKIFVDQIVRRAEWCEKNGIKFIFLIAPNKHSVYPEYYPYERPEGPTRTDQIVANLPDSLRNYFIFPRDYLISKKSDIIKPLYYETDTHWNSLGAYYAYEILSQRVQECFPHINYPQVQYKVNFKESAGGDLPPLLGLKSHGKLTEFIIEPESGGKNINKDLPAALIFRDSFFTHIEPFASTLFSKTEYVWQALGESDKGYIMRNKPDIIIWEITERRISNIINLEWK